MKLRKFYMLLFGASLILSMSDLEIKQNYDLSDYARPVADSVNIKTSVPILSREDAVELGDLLFHKRTGISRVSCADCHSLSNSGRSAVNKQHGGGLFRAKKAASYKRIYGRDPILPIDGKPFKNVTVLNSDLIHESGVLLHHGAKSLFPLEAQIDSATNAHFMQDLVLECRHDQHLQHLSNRAFGRGLSRSTSGSALAAFEQTLTTSEANVAKGIVTRPRGFLIFDTHCKGCHFGREKSTSLVLDPLHAEVVPQSLWNVWNSAGFFQTSEDITVYEAIARHRDIHVPVEVLGWRDIRAVESFMYQDMTDWRYTK